jgi:SulP family sulfate permease
MELVAQGFANIASALFGGISVTGTIARTATNVRAGARGPVAGMAHAVFLLLFILVAAPLASFIPLAALGGVLAVVAWNMAEKHEFITLLRSSRGDAAVLFATFGLTVLRDLTEGIVVGCAIGTVVVLHRLSETAAIQSGTPLVGADEADTANPRTPYDAAAVGDREVVVYRLTGAFFFGTASMVSTVLDRIGDRHKAFILDFASVPFVDSTAANVIVSLARSAARDKVRLLLTGTSPAVRHSLMAAGLAPPLGIYRETIEEALREARSPV